ncbi:MAG: hypothetical protein R3B81_09285 [bacterium]
MKLITAGLVALLLASPAYAAFDYVETFDSGFLPWTFAPNSGIVQAAGGNPGAFYQGTGPFFSGGPQPRTLFGFGDYSLPWHGNYRTDNVATIGVDAIILTSAAPSTGYFLTLFLYSDGGGVGDAQIAYQVGPQLPEVGEGWMSVDFPVPSQSATLPAGWTFQDPTPNNPPPTYDWNVLIENVDMMGFYFFDPANPGTPFQQVGIDNARVATGPVSVESESWSSVKALYR